MQSYNCWHYDSELHTGANEWVVAPNCAVVYML